MKYRRWIFFLSARPTIPIPLPTSLFINIKIFFWKIAGKWKTNFIFFFPSPLIFSPFNVNKNYKDFERIEIRKRKSFFFFPWPPPSSSRPFFLSLDFFFLLISDSLTPNLFFLFFIKNVQMPILTEIFLNFFHFGLIFYCILFFKLRIFICIKKRHFYNFIIFFLFFYLMRDGGGSGHGLLTPYYLAMLCDVPPIRSNPI